MASDTGNSDRLWKDLKLKGIGRYWFLNISGKLKRLAILDNAKDVNIVDNVIFADDKLYQVFTSDDSEIVVSEIKDVRITLNTVRKLKGNKSSEIDRCDNGESVGSAKNSPYNDGPSDRSGNPVSELGDAHTTNKRKGNRSLSEAVTNADISDDDKCVGSAENSMFSSSDDVNLNVVTKYEGNSASDSDSEADYDLEKSQEEYIDEEVVVTKYDRNSASSSDSEADYDLEKGHEEYIAKKGILREMFLRVKKAVKRKPSLKRKKTFKKEEPIHNEIPHDDSGSVLSSTDDNNANGHMMSVFNNTDGDLGSKLVTALYDFNAFLDDEISFKRKDRIKLYGEDNSEWCSAEHLGTGKKGYIPRAFVTNNISSPEFTECWFNVDRRSAEQLLLHHNFPPGTFLIRPYYGLSVNKSIYVLSVLCRESESKEFLVSHYTISHDFGRLFLYSKTTFTSLSELVDFYRCTTNGNELRCRLRGTIPQHPPVVYPREMEVTRKSLGHMVPLEGGKYENFLSGRFFDTLDVTVAKLATEKISLEVFREKATLLYNLKDPKAQIVRMIAVCFEPKSYLVVLGETIYCTLKEYLQTNEKIVRNLDVLFQYAAQVADGMAFLERNNEVHGFLRADCVFVCYPYVVKISHPRLNELISCTSRNKTIQDGWKWTALEAVNDKSKYNTKSDVWSYGVLLYEIITLGGEPYKGLTKEEAVIYLEGGKRLQIPMNIPLKVYVTMLKCWHKDPDCRPTFEYLRELFQELYSSTAYGIGSKGLGSQSDSQSTNRDSANQKVTIKTFEEATSKPSVIARYSYVAGANDEISMKENDIITDVDPINDGLWFMGTAPDGKRGMFPSNYVDVLEGLESHSDLQSTDDDSTKRKVTAKTFEEATNKPSVIARYSYEAGADDEISMDENDILTDVDPINDGWSMGTAPDGKRGMFPSNYVDVLEGADDEILVTMIENDITTVDHIEDGCSSMGSAPDGKRDDVDGLRCALDTPCPKIPPCGNIADLEVSRKSVKLLHILGRGIYVNIYAGKWLNEVDEVDVTVKNLNRGTMTADTFLEGAKLMCQLRHDKVLKLMAVCTTIEPIWIITEPMINGTLLDYLRNDDGKQLQIEDLTGMAGQIADGMAYLETIKCVLVDLRAASILVGHHNEVKLAEFSYACLFEGDIYEAPTDTIFPMKWTAPEAAFDQKFSTKSDVWSFGVVLYELITFGKKPYPGKNGYETLELVEYGYRMPKPIDGPVPCPEPYYKIMLKCWNRVADSRPTFAYLYDFFNNYKLTADLGY